MPTQIKVEATITLGSLAKGMEDHVKALVDLGVVPVLINGKSHVTYVHIYSHSHFLYCTVSTMINSSASFTAFDRNCKTHHASAKQFSQHEPSITQQNQ
jgi:hypothetical protein